MVKHLMPKAVTVGDVRAFAESFGLEFPPPRKGELWRNIPETTHLRYCQDIAYHHGVQRLKSTLEDAQLRARKKKEPLAWEHFNFAHQVYLKLEQPKEV